MELRVIPSMVSAMWSRKPGQGFSDIARAMGWITESYQFVGFRVRPRLLKRVCLSSPPLLCEELCYRACR